MSKGLAEFISYLIAKFIDSSLNVRSVSSYEYEMLENRMRDGKYDEVEKWLDALFQHKLKVRINQTMTLNEYQSCALETAIYPDKIIYPTLGLTGEAGEVADKVKKIIRDNNKEFTPEKKAEIMKEIGDVMWYCATLSHDLGYTLEEVAKTNVDKLRSRQARHTLGGSGDNR